MRKILLPFFAVLLTSCAATNSYKQMIFTGDEITMSRANLPPLEAMRIDKHFTLRDDVDYSPMGCNAIKKHFDIDGIAKYIGALSKISDADARIIHEGKDISKAACPSEGVLTFSDGSQAALFLTERGIARLTFSGDGKNDGLYYCHFCAKFQMQFYMFFEMTAKDMFR